MISFFIESLKRPNNNFKMTDITFVSPLATQGHPLTVNSPTTIPD